MFFSIGRNCLPEAKLREYVVHIIDILPNKKKFKGGLFEKIHFQNFQKNRCHFLNFENFDIFLGPFDRVKNSSSHERKTNWICIFGRKLHNFGKYFGSFYEIVRLSPTAHHSWKKNFRETVKHVFLHFECRITYFHAKIFWQPHADLIAWFEMESILNHSISKSWNCTKGIN